MKIEINDNLESGDCGLWYDVMVYDTVYGKVVHCVCPYDKCKSFKQAIAFYKKTYHQPRYEPICVQHHKFSKETLDQLSLAA